MDPVAFATARLDEEQARTEAMEHFTVFEQPYYSCAGSRTEPYGDLEWGEEHCDCHLAKRKARALRDVEAGRRILARYQDCLTRMEDPDYPQGVARDQAREYEDFVLPNLLTRWADHPDYDQEWKP